MDANLRLVFLMASIILGIFAKPAPDSAEIVPRPPGYSYGGIPYGSVSGQLSLYYGDYEPIVLSADKSKIDVYLSPDKEIIESIQLLR